MNQKKLRIASFFTGIGGFDLAFEQAGETSDQVECRVVFQCERDAFCQKVLKKHWPNVALSTDIAKLEASDVPDAEVWCGGFPCQDLSLANQGKRKGLEGARSGLFNQFAGLAGQAHFRPKWLILENVPGLLNSAGGADFKYVLETLDGLGYFVAWRVLDAKHFGTPQRRRRVFIVASYQNDGAARVLFDNKVLGTMAGAVKIPVNTTSEFTRSSFQEADLFAIQHATIGRKPEAGPQAKGWRNDGETYTLDSRGSSDVVCAPYDGFRVRDTAGVPGELDSRRLRACGNAVCVHVVRWIAERIIAVEAGEGIDIAERSSYATLDS
ncbi:MAG: DNA (cytosine-5-)-methyltransferase [Armatimonadota bacterium]